MRVEAMAAEELEWLVEDLQDLRHDLGKYIGFEVRFLGPDPAEDELRAALDADLRRTRRSGGAVMSCGQVWAACRPDSLADDPDVRAIDALVAHLDAADIAGADLPALAAMAEQARQVGEHTRTLFKRAMAAQETLDVR